MYIKVHVVAGARKERVTKESDTEFHIHVKEPAERNMANKRVREILAWELGISPVKVKMLTGHRSPSKVYTVDV